MMGAQLPVMLAIAQGLQLWPLVADGHPAYQPPDELLSTITAQHVALPARHGLPGGQGS